jgi:hypothetical protein
VPFSKSGRYKEAAGDLWRGEDTDGRFAYIQVAGPRVPRPFPGAFVRALPGMHERALDHEELMVLTRGREQFMIRVPAEAFAKRPNFFYEGTFELPRGFVYPPPMRTTPLHRTRSSIWDTDGERLSPEAYLAKHPGADLAELALPTLPFPGLLINMVRAGWTPRMHDDDPRWLARLLGPEDAQPGPPREVQTTHFLTFGTEESAVSAQHEAAKAIGSPGTNVQEPIEVGESWSLAVTVPGLPDETHEERLRQIAKRLRGVYDGDEVGPL